MTAPAREQTLQDMAAGWYADVEAAGRVMTSAVVVPDHVASTIDAIADYLGDYPMRSFFAGSDPYLGQAVLAATLACEKGLRSANDDAVRQRVRLGLERLRQALRDIVDESPTADTRPVKEVARWLVQQVSVPQSQLADLLLISSRTLQRWVSTTDPAAPEDDDEARLRAVAQVTSHLRHVFTAPGVIRWFERANPHLDGAAPRELLADPLELPRLMRLASLSRSTLSS